MQGRDFDVYVLLGDGELHEGQVWEAAMSAAHHRARNLIAIVDRNGYCLDGGVDEVMGIEPLAEKWRAFGWEVHEVDGHDVDALASLLRGAGGRRAATARRASSPTRSRARASASWRASPGGTSAISTPADERARLAELRG